jgi:hypothetical protein
MSTSEQTAEAFRNLDFHDDSLIEVRILPAMHRGQGVRSTVEIHLQQYSEKKPRIVRFSGCANVRAAIDFDVLAHNFPPNTSRVEAETSLGRIRNLVESQKQDWDVQYAGTGGSPLSKKLASLKELVFFRVQFFGGALEVVARDYRVECGPGRTASERAC